MAIVIQDCVVVAIIPTEPNANPAAKIYFFIIIFLREVFKYQAKVTFFLACIFSLLFPCKKIPRFSLQFLVKTNARFARAIFTAGFPLQSLTQNNSEFQHPSSIIRHPTSNIQLLNISKFYQQLLPILHWA